MARRVRVRWTTEEVLEFEEDFEVPDEVADEDVEDYYTDGNCPDLVDVSSEAGALMTFERETQSVVWLEGQPEPRPEAGEYTIKLQWVVEADSAEQAAEEFRSQLTNPHLSLLITKPDGNVVEV